MRESRKVKRLFGPSLSPAELRRTWLRIEGETGLPRKVSYSSLPKLHVSTMGMPQKDAFEKLFLEVTKNMRASHSCYRGVATLIHFQYGCAEIGSLEIA